MRTQTFEWATPEALRELVNCLGSASAAARPIGVTGSTVSKALNENKVRKTIELAARHELGKRTSAKQKRATRMFVVRVNAEHELAFKSFVNAIGGKALNFNMEDEA